MNVLLPLLGFQLPRQMVSLARISLLKLASNTSYQADPPQEHILHLAPPLTPHFGTRPVCIPYQLTQALTLCVGQPFYRASLLPFLGSDTSCQGDDRVDTLLNTVELGQNFQSTPALWTHSSSHLNTPLCFSIPCYNVDTVPYLSCLLQYF